MSNNFKRVDLLIEASALSYLNDLPGTLSEHVRRAVDEYIMKLQNSSVRESPSKHGKN